MRSRTTTRNYVVDADMCNGAWPASRPARPAASTTGAPCRRRRPTRSRSSSAGTSLPAELSDRAARKPASAARKPPLHAAAGAGAVSRGIEPGEAAFHSRRTTAPPCRRGRRRMPTPTCIGPKTRPRPDGHGGRATFACTEVGYENDTHHIVLDFGAMPFPVLEGQSHRASSRPALDASGQAALPAAVLDRQPAQRRAPRLQQHLADGQARAGGSRRQAGARRGQQLHVRSARWATRCRSSAPSARAS